jgi:hypothetical protein
VLVLGAAAACGHPEQRIVDQYFNAVRQKDQQTLQSFAAVNFDKPVDSWKVKETLEESKDPAPLPELVAKQRAAEKAVADNKKAASSYNLDRYADIDAVKNARKAGAAVPAKLADVAAKWDEFNANDQKHKREAAQARDAVEKEKRAMAKSVGTEENLDRMTGEVQQKKILVTVTSKGDPKDYVMTLRKYVMKDAAGVKAQSRWVVQDLQPR